MAMELPLETDLERLDALLERLGGYARELGLEPERRQQVAAAAAKAFSALCLDRCCRGPAVFSLERSRGELHLSLRFRLEPGARPLGLDQALFCPPALRATLRREGDRAVWGLFWED